LINDADRDFDRVFAWILNLQRDPQAFEKINTRENIIREVVASLRLSGIDVKPEWVDEMRRRQEGE
jgi:hypothetical protein